MDVRHVMEYNEAMMIKCVPTINGLPENERRACIKSALSYGYGEIPVVVTNIMAKLSMNYENQQSNVGQFEITADMDIPDPEFLLSYEGQGFLSAGNINAVTGLRKSGKTHILSAMIITLLAGEYNGLEAVNENPYITFVDTEQGQAHTKLLLQQIESEVGQEVGDRLKFYNLRTQGWRESRSIIQDILAQRQVPEDSKSVIIIDGVVDLCENFNEEGPSLESVNYLNNLCVDFGCTVVTAIHQNQSTESNKMRGHLGSILAEKAALSMQCKNDNGIITVTNLYSRDAPMPTWSMRFREDGTLEGMKTTTARPKNKYEKNLDIIRPQFEGKEYLTREEITGLGAKQTRNGKIKELIDLGYLREPETHKLVLAEKKFD